MTKLKARQNERTVTPAGKRAVFFGAMFLAIMTSTSVSADTEKQWQFKVYLDDKHIGEHSYVVSDAADTQTIRSQANFDVKILFVTAFSYQHENTEIWQNGCLSEIDASTVVNGKSSSVEGRRDKGIFSMQTNESATLLDGCVSTFAYWDRDFLGKTQLLNSQTGELKPVKVSQLGQEIYTYKNFEIEATRYEIVVDENPISLWYVQDGRWLGLETLAKGGRVLRYHPVDVPDAQLVLSGI